MRVPNSNAPIVLGAGGTGGHIFPAEALARELVTRGRVVVLVTDRRGQSFGERVPGVATHRIRAGRFDAGLVSKVVGAAELTFGIAQAVLKLRALAPAAVVGFGGYPSVPTVLAAARLGIPSLIHEQNALLGRANRFLAPRVDRIALSFAVTGGLRPDGRRRHRGHHHWRQPGREDLQRDRAGSTRSFACAAARTPAA